MSEPGVDTSVSLTCQRCGASTEESSDDASFNAEKAIENAQWGWGDPDMELVCDECLDKQNEDEHE